MTYELARELKEAGYLFPERNIGMAYFEDKRLPDLSELIEACKPARILLTEEQEGKWFAFSNSNIAEEGLTAEEAVAKLWLALNRK